MAWVAARSYRPAMHRTIEPTILYFGTPVALISSLNEDGSANLAPMSSVWWLGWSCMLGLGQMGQTSANLERTRECVRSEEHTSELQSLAYLVCRLLLEKKKHKT